jgi:hypothetical protein
MRSSTLTQHGPSDNEPETSISGHSVLPSPEEGLARWISKVTPPGALTFSTPWVRVPVTAPPAFDDEVIAAHQERASKVWAAGWSPREQRRVLKALDENRSTIGARYLELAQLHPWVTLALERAGVVDGPALYLAERLTEPPLSWFAVEQARINGGDLRPESPWVPVVGDQRGPHERTVLTPYTSVALAVLADLGSASPMTLGPCPEDEHRRPSALLRAAALCGVTRPDSTTPSRGAEKARNRGRRLLHALGAWPWVCRADGDLSTRQWWTDQDVVRELAQWCRDAETADQVASHRRQALATRLGLA